MRILKIEILRVGVLSEKAILRESYTQRKLYLEKAIHRILLLENTHRAGAYAREARGA